MIIYVPPAYMIQISKKRLVMARKMSVRSPLDNPAINSVIKPFDFLSNKLREFYGAHINN